MNLDATENAIAGDLIFSLLIKPLSHAVTELREWGYTEAQVQDFIAYAVMQGMERYEAGKAKSNAGH
ncbi:MAG: hypothetical protein AB7V39_00630 [Nitrospiraceae bacterium]